MLRGVLGVVGGGVVWWFGFFGLARLLFSVWPEYAAAAHEFMTTGAREFTASMYAWNALFWVLAEIAAGWMAVFIARRREASWVLAALLMGVLCFMHLYLEWVRYPAWYNLAVALPSGLAVLLGGRLAWRFVLPRAGTALSDGGGGSPAARGV